MQIKTLEQTSLDNILQCFNESFSDYIIPLQLTREQFVTKIKSEDIRLQHSVGAFVDEQLVGFILHGVRVRKGKKYVYNSGTGVVPAHRGNKITKKMYAFVLDYLKELSANITVLEVIVGNDRANKVYLDTGFQNTRKFYAYKGQLNTGFANNYPVDRIETWDWRLFQSFWDIEPSWQYAIESVENTRAELVTIGIKENNDLLAYLTFNPTTKRIHQFAVHKAHRNKCLGKTLFHHVAKNYGPAVTVIGVDAQSEATNNFLKSIGLEVFIELYEMELALK